MPVIRTLQLDARLKQPPAELEHRIVELMNGRFARLDRTLALRRAARRASAVGPASRRDATAGRLPVPSARRHVQRRLGGCPVWRSVRLRT